MKNQLQITKRVTTLENIILDTYDLCPKNILDNLFIKYLKWKGSIKNTEVVQEITRYSNLNAKPLLDNIVEALDDANWRGEDKPVIIMGNEEFMEFTKNPSVGMNIKFNTGPLRYGGQSHDWDWYAEVRVYPHIKGIAVI